MFHSPFQEHFTWVDWMHLQIFKGRQILEKWNDFPGVWIPFQTVATPGGKN